MRNISKIISVLLLSIALFSCTKKDSQPAATANKTLNIYTWSNYVSPEVISDFEKLKGIKINISYYSSNEELVAKLQAGAKGYDLIFPSGYMVKALKALGLILPIKASEFPEVKNISDRFRKPPFDPELEYVVPFCWGTTGLAVNKSKVKSKVDGWSWVFNHPELAGQITMLDDPAEVVGAAMKSMNLGMNDITDENLKKVKELLVKQKKTLKAYTSETIPSLESGEVAIAQAYSSDVAQVVKKNPNIEYVVPKEGGVVWLDAVAIPKGAENVELAKEFIRYVTTPESAKKQINLVFTNPVISADLIPDAIAKLKAANMIPSDELMSKLEYTSDDPKIYEKLTHFWTELKAE